MSARLGEFDQLRSLATLAVVAIHVSANYAAVLPAAYLVNQTVRFAVPLFIILSGYLLYRSSDPEDSYLSFYKNRSDKVLWPYLIWTGIYYLYDLAAQGSFDDGLVLMRNLGEHLLWGSAFYHLYFMVIIIQFYLLFPLLREGMKKSPRLVLLVSLLVTVLAQTLLCLHALNIISLPPEPGPFYWLGFPAWVFYFCLGMYHANQLQVDKSRTSMPGMFLAWIMSLGVLLVEGKVSGLYASSIKPTVLIYTVVSYLFFYQCCSASPRSSSTRIYWFSSQSFLIYLLHPVMLEALTRPVKLLGYPDPWTGITGMFLLYTCTLLTTVGVVFLLSHTPVIKYLGGKTKDKRVRVRSEA